MRRCAWRRCLQHPTPPPLRIPTHRALHVAGPTARCNQFRNDRNLGRYAKNYGCGFRYVYKIHISTPCRIWVTVSSKVATGAVRSAATRSWIRDRCRRARWSIRARRTVVLLNRFAKQAQRDFFRFRVEAIQAPLQKRTICFCASNAIKAVAYAHSAIALLRAAAAHAIGSAQPQTIKEFFLPWTSQLSTKPSLTETLEL